MRPEHQELLRRLEHFDFDVSFAPRLARENDWTAAYAERVCEEYKRFAFLTIAAGHPCTPSDQVDQAWHLHILQTRSYWEDFCNDVLKQPLHHEPTRGGVAEAAKFRGWYEDTLQSYHRFFGVLPPADIWPATAERFAARPVRIDRQAFWLARKPEWLLARSQSQSVLWASRLYRWIWLAIASVTVAGCTVLHNVPPFSASGGDFLIFFVVLWLVSVITSEVLRHIYDAAQPASSELDPYQDIFLLGGPTLTAHAVIAALIERGVLHMDATTKRLTATGKPLLDPHPIEATALRQAAMLNGGESLADLRDFLAQHSDALTLQLEQRGLLLPRTKMLQWLLLALIAPLFGVIKMGVGIAFDKPIGYLTVLCALSVLFAVVRYGRKQRLTTAGKQVIERLREPTRSASDSKATWSSVDIAVALFGAQIIADTAFAMPEKTHNNDAGGGCGGVTSGSGHDGGGGGGGGGCGGGGCGGCGGG